MKFATAEKPITTKHPKLGELSIDKAEVPQIDSVEDAVAFCGGEDGFKAYFNNAIETSAKNTGRAALRNAGEDANVEELYTKVRGLVKDYTPQAAESGGVSVKRKAEARDKAIAALESGEELTKEQLLEMLKSAR